MSTRMVAETSITQRARLAEEDQGFSYIVANYLKNYITADSVRKKISWLRGAIAVTIEALRPEKKYSGDVEILEQAMMRLRELSRSVHWELWERYKGGQFDLIPDEQFWEIADVLTELDDIRDTLLRVLYRTELIQKTVEQVVL